jgi:hypothetical protein
MQHSRAKNRLIESPLDLFQISESSFSWKYSFGIFWIENTRIYFAKSGQAQLVGLIGGGCSPEYAEKYD